MPPIQFLIYASQAGSCDLLILLWCRRRRIEVHTGHAHLQRSATIGQVIILLYEAETKTVEKGESQEKKWEAQEKKWEVWETKWEEERLEQQKKWEAQEKKWEAQEKK
ncbi:MAG: DUF1682 domain-containing protein, partial [Gammaproteobacteria bacterium]|nr:DUF1682 domain-containing protein [Gammaproteobacteria bacterium]